jgi:hypothetical protein
MRKGGFAMRKIIVTACVAGLLLATGCGLAVGPYMPGLGYSDIRGPVTATGDQPGSKTGMATVVNYAGIVSLGDASIVAAAKDGGITKIRTVDFQMVNYSPFYAQTTTIVTGE